MEHIGIDLGSRTSSVCIVGVDGNVRRETSARTRELEAWLAKRTPSRVVIESCAESRRVAQLAKASGHEVRVVPTHVVRALGVGQRGIKTDRRDARSLAEAAFRMGEHLPHIHLKSDEASRAQWLLRARAQLVEMRTAAINFVRSQMRAELLERLRSASAQFADNMREQHCELAEVPQVAVQLGVLDTLAVQIETLDVEIGKLAQGEQHQRLRVISGVGPIVSVAFIAAIDDPKRFSSGAKVASYLGLSPGENTTGGKRRRTGIIAAGQKQIRKLLVQAAHSMMNTRRTREPMARWAEELARTKGRRVAITALARRLAIVMWAMLRDGTKYDPTKTKPRLPSEAAETTSVFTDTASVIG